MGNISGVVAGVAVAVNVWQYRIRQRTEGSNAQQERFNKSQDRFAPTNDTITRRNAAFSLAELAKETKHGVKDKGVSAENNPFFLPVVTSLVVALRIEDDADVCDACLEALQTITVFAKEHDPTNALLWVTISKLYDANIKAKTAFIQSLVEYCAAHGGMTANLSALAQATPFTSESNHNSRDT